MDEIEKIPEIEPLDDLGELPMTDLDFGPAPRLKDYFQSPDAPSRYLIILSILFGFLAVFCFGMLVFQYLKLRHYAQKTAAPVAEVVKIDPTFHESLGLFKVVWNNAEMNADLVAECTTEEACAELKNRNTEARDLIFPLLQESSRSTILNPSQKLYLRQQLGERLNKLHLKGRVIKVDFTDLMIEPRK